MKAQILELLENNAKLTPEKLGIMLGEEPEKIAKIIADCEEDKTILSYHTVINWDKTEKRTVQALIELKTIPQKDRGFDSIAERICAYDEVKSVKLMSGGFDLALTVECANMRDVAMFVAERLATIDGVTSTSTHFAMETYKDNGVVYMQESSDKRGNSW